ncbi:MAG: hypothetical protein L0Z62_10365 [Gemmataceae bacterium]|nr:hypothetical protein [Gemmataceae bacterium]
MRTLLPLLLVAAGCHSMYPPCPPDCCEVRKAPECCPPECAQAPPPRAQLSMNPCPTPPPEAPTQVQVRQPPVVHVKVPPQKVVVQAPAQPSPVAPVAPTAAAPQMAAPYQSPYQSLGAIAQSVPVGRARPGITLDFIRIPIPILRLIAVPTTPEITVPWAAAQAIPVAPVPQALPVAAPVAPTYVQALPQPVVPVQPQVVAPAQPQAQAVVPVQGHAVVPVQGQAIVPVQGQAVVPVQGQPVAAPVVAQPVAPQAFPVAPQAARPLSLEEVEEFCRRVQALKAALEARSGAAPTAEK